MIDARALLVAMLDAVERDPALRARVRDVLGSTATTNAPDALVGARDAGIPRLTWRAACREQRIVGARQVGRE